MGQLDAMHLFIRLAELGSFTAAQQLGVARSVVTQQIAGLEVRLGAKLMVRSTRRLMLTSAGTANLERCRVIVNLVQAAENDVAEERLAPRGNRHVPYMAGAVMDYLAQGLSSVTSCEVPNPWVQEFDPEKAAT